MATSEALGEQLTQAHESRIVVEQAPGMLQRASQRENRKIHQIATDLVSGTERRATAE